MFGAVRGHSLLWRVLQREDSEHNDAERSIKRSILILSLCFWLVAMAVISFQVRVWEESTKRSLSLQAAGWYVRPSVILEIVFL
ncbi:hypothetical protein FKP32DRAFT_105664 [Trametes sanguinea]|nr:hypothetical protein FKP32DRAFT_105664 [Trametes sanguinea]